MSTTINDVAREAGVSITTVSRVLNNNYPVKEETRIRIENAIERLSYKPNAMARSLITKKTSVIGIVVPGITNLFFSTIVESIEDSIRSKGYSISLCNTNGDHEIEKDLIFQLICRQVDGIIVIDPSIENLENGYYDKISKDTPTIIVNGSPRGCNCNFVCYDEEIGAREAFDYLISLEHKKIAFLRGDKSLSYELKENIYRDIVENQNFNYEKVINVGRGNSIEVVEKVQLKVEELLNGEEAPTAIFACNDLMALGIINACNKLGLNVPEDLSVIGFDNTLLSDVSHPKITSVDLNMKTIGNKAAIELMDIIDNGIQIRKKLIFNTNLVIKESCEKYRPKNK